MEKTYTLAEISKTMTEKDSFLSIAQKYIIIREEETFALKGLYLKCGHDSYHAIDFPTLIKKIVEHLKDKVNVEMMLNEILSKWSSIPEILELSERIEKEPSVTSAKRCYSLMIGGKRGRPYEFNLVGKPY